MKLKLVVLFSLVFNLLMGQTDTIMTLGGSFTVTVIQPSCLGKSDGSIRFSYPYSEYSITDIEYGLYTITIIDSNYQNTLEFRMIGDNICDYYIPNAMKIGSDEFRLFTPLSVEYNLTILDRWGSLLFKERCVSNISGWSGMVNGRSVQTGVYIYFIEVNSQRFSGTLTIINND